MTGDGGGGRGGARRPAGPDPGKAAGGGAPEGEWERINTVLRRRGLRAAFRALLTAALLVTFYYVLPLDESASAVVAVFLTLGVLGTVAVLVWQAAAIVRSPYPVLRAVEAFALVVPLFVLVFSTAYYLMARQDVVAFGTPLTRTDALYFTVTVLATVGFGDIVPRSQVARLVVTGQMAGGLLLLGAAARILVGAARMGLRRRDADEAGRR
jgi:hypothetical protein